MTKQELRNEFVRLAEGENIQDSLDLMDLYLGYLFLVANEHKKNDNTSISDSEAILINQMLFSKIAHLRQVVKGIEYEAINGIRLNRIVDPTVVAVLIRNIYETVAMFNLVNLSGQNADEKLILYNLWVISGLKYRQKFVHEKLSAETVKKSEHEKLQIDKYIQEIMTTSLYKQLSTSNQNKIQEKIKRKDYKIRFNNNNVEFLDWQDLSKTMGIKDSIMGNIYTYFSLYSHPSNVSVFQFADMFRKDVPHFIEMTNFNLRNAFFLLSVFIADYIILFPEVLKIYNSIPIKDQIVINWLNVMARNNDYSINDSFTNLN